MDKRPNPLFLDWLAHVDCQAYVFAREPVIDDVRVWIRNNLPKVEIHGRYLSSYDQSLTMKEKMERFAYYYAREYVTAQLKDLYLGRDMSAVFIGHVLSEREPSAWWAFKNNNPRNETSQIFIIPEWRAHNPGGFLSWL